MIEELIPGYPAGSNITLLNTYYIRPKRDDNGKYGDDSITLIYRDNNTGIKRHHTIYKPDYILYIANDDKVSETPEFFKPLNDCKEVRVPYKNILKEIAELTDILDFFYENIRNHDVRNNIKLNMNPKVLFSDVNIEDHYRYRFDQMYVNDTYKLNKGYCDIEVDGRYTINEFPDLGEVPVNAVSYFNEKEDTLYTFLLREPNNPLCKQFEDKFNSNPSAFYDKAKQFITNHVGGIKQATRFGIINSKIKLQFYSEEVDLLKSLFQCIRSGDVDFLLFWNAAFDCNYIIERCKVLGYDPAEIISDPNFEEPTAYYYTDERNYSEFAERGDFAKFSINTVVLCQMIQFASRRKGRGAIPNFKLDTISEMIAKVRKLSYADITNKLEDLPYLDYERFVLYNMIDVIDQKCIEAKTGDIDYVFNKALRNNTRYPKVHRQTTYLANRFSKEFMNLGFVIGNNCNKFNVKEGKFPGALVGDPTHTNDYAKIFVHGVATMVANNLMDEDYKSLYPSISLENNVAPNTLIGIIQLDHQVYKDENPYKGLDPEKDEKFSRVAEMMDLYITGNDVIFAERYLHLAGFEEVLKDINEFATHDYIGVAGILNPLTDNGKRIIYYNTQVNTKIDVMHFDDRKPKMQPIICLDKLDSEFKSELKNTMKGNFYDKGRI